MLGGGRLRAMLWAVLREMLRAVLHVAASVLHVKPMVLLKWDERAWGWREWGAAVE